MADEDELTHADDEVTEPQKTSEPKPTAEETPRPDEEEPQPEPIWKSRYRSPDEMFNDVKRLQSKADTLETELKRQGVQMQTPAKPNKEERLEEFAKDPDRFLDERFAGVEARLVLNDFLNEHPDYKKYKNQVVQSLGNNIGVLSNPIAVEMAFSFVKTKDEESKMNTATEKVKEHQKQVQESKKGDAFVEGATKAQRKSPKTIKPGMSVEESEKVLDEMGIGWVDEEIH